MAEEKEINFKVGRLAQQGHVWLSAHIPHLLTLSVSYKGERASTVVLTSGQVRELRSALAALEPQVELGEGRADGRGEWLGRAA